ncbi:hypothetical protein [Sphingomonas sp. DBB INV C78]|uniref:hypothetical protein n=1 Tax=Sphingomonas sp. DBB INV C78 TaxID=3349434 RepID=UPI0036D22EC3
MEIIDALASRTATIIRRIMFPPLNGISLTNHTKSRNWKLIGYAQAASAAPLAGLTNACLITAPPAPVLHIAFI